jgi:hypothetical protein
MFLHLGKLLLKILGIPQIDEAGNRDAWSPIRVSLVASSGTFQQDLTLVGRESAVELPT